MSLWGRTRVAMTLTLFGPVEQLGRFSSVRHPQIRLPQLVEEWVADGFHGCQSRAGRVFKQAADKINRFWWRSWPEYFGEGMWPDLWEFVLHVVWVHGLDLLLCRGTQHLDDLDELVNAALSRE